MANVPSIPAHLLNAPQSGGTQFTATGSARGDEFGAQAGKQIFELQRKRLASLGQGQQRNLSRLFAGRGGGASSAAAASGRQQQVAERSALADASLQSQLEGRRLGMAENQRLAQQNQFAAQLAQSTDLANLQARLGIQSQALGGQQALQQQLLRIQAQRDAAKKASRGKFLSGLGSAVGGIAGTMLLPGVGTALGASLGGSLGGSAGGQGDFFSSGDTFA